MRTVVSYAQNREDVILNGFFPDVSEGFYIDIGAHHPVKDSVTKLFYDKHWHGINIEPIQRFAVELQKARPRDETLAIGCGAKREVRMLREYVKGEGLSTFSPTIQKHYEAVPSPQTDEYIEQEVEIYPLKDILAERKISTIHFLKIDVEGLEYEVLMGNDWQKYRPEVICIEAKHEKSKWQPLLEKHDYKEVFFDGLNSYFVDAKKPQRLQFSYPEAVLPYVVVPAQIAKELKEKGSKVFELQHDVARLEIQVKELKRERDHLHFEIARSKRLRSVVLQLLRSTDAATQAYIKALDKPRTRAKSQFEATANDPRQLLAATRVYDLKNNYQTRPHNTRASYIIAQKTYDIVKKPAAKTARKVLHKLKGRNK
jgi:FkbM family methyltransferase